MFLRFPPTAPNKKKNCFSLTFFFCFNPSSNDLQRVEEGGKGKHEANDMKPKPPCITCGDPNRVKTLGGGTINMYRYHCTHCNVRWQQSPPHFLSVSEIPNIVITKSKKKADPIQEKSERGTNKSTTTSKEVKQKKPIVQKSVKKGGGPSSAEYMDHIEVRDETELDANDVSEMMSSSPPFQHVTTSLPFARYAQDG